MKTYECLVPITGYCVVTIEAENEEDAKKKALLYEFKTEEIETWETHEKICEGNVLHAEINEIDIEEV